MLIEKFRSARSSKLLYFFLRSQKMESPPEKRRKFGSFILNNSVTKHELELIRAIGDILKVKRNQSHCIIYKQHETDWDTFQKFMTKSECFELVLFMKRQNYQSSRNSHLNLKKIPQLIERLEFSRLAHLSLAEVSLSSCESLTNLDAPELEVIDISDCPHVDFKSLEKTNLKSLKYFFCYSRHIIVVTENVSSLNSCRRINMSEDCVGIDVEILRNDKENRVKKRAKVNYNSFFMVNFGMYLFAGKYIINKPKYQAPVVQNQQDDSQHGSEDQSSNDSDQQQDETNQ